MFENPIQFWQPNYVSELVYSTEVQKDQAVESAFEVAASWGMVSPFSLRSIT